MATLADRGTVGERLQARQFRRDVSLEVFQSLPYVVTVVVLVLVSSLWSKRLRGAPAALGLPYEREER